MLHINFSNHQSRYLSRKTLFLVLICIIFTLTCTLNSFGQCDNGYKVELAPGPNSELVATPVDNRVPALTFTAAPVPNEPTPVQVQLTFEGSGAPNICYPVDPRYTGTTVQVFPGGASTEETQIDYSNGNFSLKFKTSLLAGFVLTIPKNTSGKEFNIDLKNKIVTINSPSAKTISLKLNKKISLKLNNITEDPGLTNDLKNYELKLTKKGEVKIDYKNNTISVTSDGATIKKKQN